jgi:hypothetical protein
VARGDFCISIDLELAWGIWDKPSGVYFRACAEKERRIVAALLEILGRHEMSATWAVVGRLLDRTPAPPVSTEYGDRIWYAPDLIEQIRRVPGQDVGSHSYAHIYFETALRDAIDADLEAARAVHERHGLPMTSFVFPRNQVAQLDRLAAAGIAVFRSTDHGWHAAVRSRVGGPIGRAANLADKIFAIPPATVTPKRCGELIELPSSMLLLAREGLRRLVRPEALVAKARLGLRRAARRGELFHLWFHPSNFYEDTDRQLAVFADIAAAAARARDRGELAVRTMASYAA